MAKVTPDTDITLAKDLAEATEIADGDFLIGRDVSEGQEKLFPTSAIAGAIPVTRFGAVGDGVADDTGAIQSAANSLPSGGTLWMPPGSYRLTGAGLSPGDGCIEVSGVDRVSIMGPGALKLDDNFVQVFKFTNCDDVLLSGIRIDATWTGAVASSAERNLAVWADNCDRLQLRDVVATGVQLVLLDDCNDVQISGVFGDTEVDVGTIAVGGTGYSYGIRTRNCSNCVLEGVSLHNYSTDGIKLSQNESISGSRVVISNFLLSGMLNDDAIDVFDAGADTVIAGGVIWDCQKGWNIKVSGGSGTASRVLMANVINLGGEWDTGESSNQSGGNIEADYTQLSNVQVHDIDGTGLLILGGAHGVHLSNVLVRNVTDSSGDGRGIDISDAESMVFLSNVRIEDVAEFGLFSTSSHLVWLGGHVLDPGSRGIQLNPGESTADQAHTVLIGIKVTADQASPTYGIRQSSQADVAAYIIACQTDGSFITSDVRFDGINPIQLANSWNGGKLVLPSGVKNSGTASLTGDGSTVTDATFAHGLDDTPALADISVTPTSSLGAASEFFVSAVDGTNITISLDVDPGNAVQVDFVWQAELT